MQKPDLLPLTFYTRPTLAVAKDLIGKCLVHRYRGQDLVGRIVETEAYTNDPASHAHRGRTKRNDVMFGPGGRAYVYFVYGMHYCFNAVTETAGTPGAVLIRAIEPLKGMEVMLRRRRATTMVGLSNGPGKLCQAMAIGPDHCGIQLTGERLFLTDDGFKPHRIRRTPRIGVRVGTERLWRFVLDGHPCVTASKFNRHGV